MSQGRAIANFNWALLGVMLALFGAGIVNLYSATVARESTSQYYLNQLYWFGIGLAGVIAVQFFDYRHADRFAYVFYAVCLLGLVLVAVKGKTVFGGRRWLSLGPVSLQPSEFMKLGLIVALAHFFNARQDEGPYGFKQLWVPLLLAAVPAALIIRQPDLGTATILLLVAFSMLLFARMKLSTLLLSVVIGVSTMLVSWQYILKNYQKRRVLAFMDPGADLLGSGYHANQSMIAVGSGKGLGKGFMASTQSQFSFLPEQHTDFIFSVFSEEWGYAGVLAIMFMFLLLLFLVLECSRTAREKFGVFVPAGVFFMIFWHLVINVGMVSGLMPVVGVTLPFFSSGGSSLIAVMLGIGLALNINMRRHGY
ncbi:MAG: rod shape-determining protein RodA [Deltaproteobacteria bacterium]|nr:rod shape-determining protein RodA [Deltaproteobacteria bacterium]